VGSHRLFQTGREEGAATDGGEEDARGGGAALLLRRHSEKVRNDIDTLIKRKARASDKIRKVKEWKGNQVRERDRLPQIVEVYADQGELVVLLNGCHAENDTLRASVERHASELRSIREKRDRLRRAADDAAIALGAELADHEAEQTENIIAEMIIHGGDLGEIDENDRTQKTVLRRDRPKEIQKTVFEFFKIVTTFQKENPFSSKIRENGIESIQRG